jgi:hypothetical protein
MLILSLKIRGVGGASNLIALKELLFLAKPNIVFLQETMVDHLRAKDFFLKFFPSWNCVATDSISLSWGLLFVWNHHVGCVSTNICSDKSNSKAL